MKCTVNKRGKFFIVVDPIHHKSYTVNTKVDADDLCETLNDIPVLEELLEQVKKELTCLDGLKVTDYDCPSKGYISLNVKDLTVCDYSRLIDEIDQVIK